MIIFNNEKHFRLPLEPFNCFFISVLPIVFWREMLNIKKKFTDKAPLLVLALQEVRQVEQ